MKRITTGPRVILRHLTLDDAPVILTLLNDPGWLRFIGDRGVRDLDGARDYLQNGPIASYAENGFGLYCVIDNKTHEPLGLCGIIRRAGLDHPDLGYGFLAQYGGKGLAREAAELTLIHARADLKLGPILAITKQDNVASMGLLKRLGFADLGLVQVFPDQPESRLFRHDAVSQPSQEPQTP
jgi:RimJ/RimL family protein N-acetyltransferase